jgi:hypothetical protein
MSESWDKWFGEAMERQHSQALQHQNMQPSRTNTNIPKKGERILSIPLIASCAQASALLII